MRASRAVRAVLLRDKCPVQANMTRPTIAFHTRWSHQGTILMESGRLHITGSSRSVVVSIARWAAVCTLVTTAMYFTVEDAVPYFLAFTPQTYGPHWGTRYWMLAHVAAGTSA